MFSSWRDGWYYNNSIKKTILLYLDINQKTNLIMKKFLLLFLLSAFFVNAQSIRVFNVKVNPGDQSSVAQLFEDYHGKGKRKSGSVHLQRVRFLNDVTHRILLTGDPSNWGNETERPASEWQAYYRGNRSLRTAGPGSYTATSLYWKDGDRDKYHSGQQWLVKVNDPAKYLAAFIKMAKAVGPMIGDRMMGVGAIRMGDLNGATHYTVFYGEDMNDVEIITDKIRNTKAFQEFVKNNGGSETLVSFGVEDLLRY